ncbi:MAG: hypothetical protein COU33_01945 [Candidatus Magasanikbacteria bacterium CG10_big_fil_rev_8_21_14_0_10_43_6]|uniref:Uncharacterized protein n=1 Tax=Candidatus Magasanikbacteria bacterium CG10_big_fil_rev_8_21_14_0_10_43_6 TaxID=1974650 RepID=A0A2M6W1J3_9BACT|nr:MAG: hypothetical protein COU33_01945 [Candidatus Magasanikbacteria bacterium CG10_big_fil_rev_8_21_14_0_10_43_6]
MGVGVVRDELVGVGVGGVFVGVGDVLPSVGDGVGCSPIPPVGVGLVLLVGVGVSLHWASVFLDQSSWVSVLAQVLPLRRILTSPLYILTQEVMAFLVFEISPCDQDMGVSVLAHCISVLAPFLLILKSPLYLLVQPWMSVPSLPPSPQDKAVSVEAQAPVLDILVSPLYMLTQARISVPQ